jgi:hypothetical protein
MNDNDNNPMEEWQAVNTSRENRRIAKIEEDEANVVKFRQWLAHANPGNSICYHRGEYVAGHRVGSVALTAYTQGLVILYQKRELKGFSYWAQIKRNELWSTPKLKSQSYGLSLIKT